jgi:hypothetical protein
MDCRMRIYPGGWFCKLMVLALTSIPNRNPMHIKSPSGFKSTVQGAIWVSGSSVPPSMLVSRFGHGTTLTRSS